MVPLGIPCLESQEFRVDGLEDLVHSLDLRRLQIQHVTERMHRSTRGRSGQGSTLGVAAGIGIGIGVGDIGWIKNGDGAAMGMGGAYTTGLAESRQ